MRLRSLGTRLGLLALMLQALAGAVPMPDGGMGPLSASADMPAWLGPSVCRAGDDPPATGADPLCPVCFVLCHAAAPVPPSMGPLAVLHAGAPVLVTRDRAAAIVSARSLPARGPPALA